MKRNFFQFLILMIFLLSGFFILSRPASAVYATTTNPYYSGYNFQDVSGTFVADERFWFDGGNYRYSFTPARDFYTSWINYGDRIAKGPIYSTWLNASYFFNNGGGGGSGAYFVENLTDLNGYKSGDNIFFLWEKDQRYDTYIIQGDIPSSGITSDNLFLNWHFKDYPDDRLVREYSHIKFMVRYNNNINYSHGLNYIDYGYLPALDPVVIIPGILGSWNLGFGWELDPILNTYDNLWASLKSAGYKEGETLFSFPYNWRLPNVYSAQLLKEKIDEIKNICQCAKVDVIGHSMGGLVARAYVEMGNYDNDIDQLIFLGVPHRGTPKAYLTWESGDLGQTTRDFIYERIFKVESELNGYGSVFDYIRQLPMKSIEELLPVYSYLKDKDINNDWQIRNYPNDYPPNLFLKLLNEPSQLAKLNGIDITNIIADSGESSTIRYLKVIEKDFVDGEWEHGYPDGFNSIFGDHGLEYGPGDDSSPLISSQDFSNFNDTVISSSHNAMVTDAQKIIIKELTGQESEQEFRKNIFSKYLMIRIFSPADFVVVSPNGQRVGKDFINNTSTNEIDGAFYSGFLNGSEFALIPDPVGGEYRVELQGTGDGEYKLSASLIGDDSAIDSDYGGLISLGEMDNYSVSLTAGDIADLNPDISSLGELSKEIEEMYQKGWLNHFGSKNALLSQLKNGNKNNKQFEQLNKFIDNMLEKDRINRRSYDIIKSALINIRNNY
ncbi:MAG: alpha/beta hydrolase [Candidatus Buchananbacteria bacterium]|nr:alpha/beta hydrolase [Candidatus Buchananbacteria bacterium]